MKLINQLCQTAALLTLFTANASAETRLSLSTGTDNNPFRLSDDLKDDIAIYFDHRLRYKKEFDSGFWTGVDLRSVTFNDAFRDAKRKRNIFNLGYAHQFNKQHELKSLFRLGDNNKTYISRSTGEVATSQGEVVSKRFDYGWADLRLDYVFKVNKQHRLYAELDFTKKDFVDYTHLGLSDLDYEQINGSLGWRFRPNKDWTIRLELESKTRNYTSKPNRDALGTEVAGDFLSYTYQKSNGWVRYKMTDNHQIRVYTLSETREDEFEGYYNTDFTRSGIEWRWKFEEAGTWVNEIRTQELISTNDLGENELEEEFSGYDNDGITFISSYLYDIWEKDDIKIDGYVKLIHNDFDATQPIYVYSRQRLEVGVMFKL